MCHFWTLLAKMAPYTHLWIFLCFGHVCTHISNGLVPLNCVCIGLLLRSIVYVENLQKSLTPVTNGAKRTPWDNIWRWEHLNSFARCPHG